MKLGDANHSCNQGESDYSSTFITKVMAQHTHSNDRARDAWRYALDAAKIHAGGKLVVVSETVLRRRGNTLSKSDLVLIQNHTGPWQSGKVSGSYDNDSGECHAVFHVKFTTCAKKGEKACTEEAPCEAFLGRLALESSLQHTSDPAKCGEW